MIVSDILWVWNLYMTRRFIWVYTAVYTAPCMKLPALPKGAIDNKLGLLWVIAWRRTGGQPWTQLNSPALLN